MGDARMHRSPRKKTALTLIFYVMLLAFSYSFSSDYFVPVALCLTVIVGILEIYNFVHYRSTSVEVTQANIIYRTGIFTVKEVSIPYNKIVDVRMQRSLADRLFGLATLMINTAGEGNIDFIIHDLPADKCELAYKFIGRKAGQQDDGRAAETSDSNK